VTLRKIPGNEVKAQSFAAGVEDGGGLPRLVTGLSRQPVYALPASACRYWLTPGENLLRAFSRDKRLLMVPGVQLSLLGPS